MSLCLKGPGACTSVPDRLAPTGKVRVPTSRQSSKRQRGRGTRHEAPPQISRSTSDDSNDHHDIVAERGQGKQPHAREAPAQLGMCTCPYRLARSGAAWRVASLDAVTAHSSSPSVDGLDVLTLCLFGLHSAPSRRKSGRATIAALHGGSGHASDTRSSAHGHRPTSPSPTGAEDSRSRRHADA